LDFLNRYWFFFDLLRKEEKEKKNGFFSLLSIDSTVGDW